ncbi:MAG: hypothetical protein NTW61_00865 [Candidatus Melainabacteria bacterium]|jgi:hypothetical protein|nr:hypothetical protein [Candidatus Melainabacteria bacterium]
MSEKWKNQILKTAICVWQEDTEDDDDGYYIVKSPLTARLNEYGEILGCSPNKQEAFDIFEDMVEAALVEYQKGTIAQRIGPGKPKKGKARFTAEISPESKQILAGMSLFFGNISQGEVVEYLITRYQLENPLSPYRT